MLPGMCARNYVRVHLESCLCPYKNIMILTLMEFRLESDSTSVTWINAIDRGGLWHLNDDVFALYCDIEYEIRRHLTTTRSVPHEGFKHRSLMASPAMKACSSSGVFSLQSWTHTVANCLRDMIIELYVTVRGFAWSNPRRKQSRKLKALENHCSLPQPAEETLQRVLTESV